MIIKSWLEEKMAMSGLSDGCGASIYGVPWRSKHCEKEHRCIWCGGASSMIRK